MTNSETDPEDQLYKIGLKKLLVRLILYYLAFSFALFLLFKIWPDLIKQLPVGGLNNYAANSSAGALQDAAPIFGGPNASWIQDGISLFLAMLMSLLLMIPVAWVHAAIHSGHDYDHSIDETALILPSVVAGVVMVVQHSLALAFSLAGIVAGVRFRRALSDTFDTLFIFVAIGVGLAAGVSAIEIAAIITVFFNFATVLICIFGDGLDSHYAKNRRVRRLKRKQVARSEAMAASSQAKSKDKPE